jgi:uncharacterized protein
MNKRKIILDTNLWISFLIAKDYDFIDNFIIQKKVLLVFSRELIEEFVVVTSREKFRKYFPKKDVELILNLVETFGLLVVVTSNVKCCRDAKDNFLLNTSIDSNADFLVTGDKDLLDLKRIGNTEIVTISELKQKLSVA